MGGMPAGMRCVRHAGVTRAESHVDQQLSALEAAGSKVARRRLQVDFGKDETALIRSWQVVEKI